MPISTINQNGLNAPLTLTSPVLTTPNLGTPSAINLTNATSLPKAALPTGSVLQVVNASTNVTTSNSSSTYADTGLSASITPLYSTSKILVIVDQTGLQKQSSDTWLSLQLVRGSTAILQFEAQALYTSSTLFLNVGGVGCSYLDSPATTSSTTYKTQFRSGAGLSSVTVQAGSNGGYSTMTLMEIAA